jgi:hypothetical protein
MLLLLVFYVFFLKTDTSFVLQTDSDVVCLDIFAVYLIKNMLNALCAVIIPV